MTSSGGLLSRVRVESPPTSKGQAHWHRRPRCAPAMRLAPALTRVAPASAREGRSIGDQAYLLQLGEMPAWPHEPASVAPAMNRRKKRTMRIKVQLTTHG
jgi:hypothetical protein